MKENDPYKAHGHVKNPLMCYGFIEVTILKTKKYASTQMCLFDMIYF